MIRQLKDGKCRLYSRKTDEKTGKRRNLGAFETCEAAEKHEREVQYSSGIEGGLFGAYLWRPRWRHVASLRDRFTLNSAKHTAALRLMSSFGPTWRLSGHRDRCESETGACMYRVERCHKMGRANR